jgi:hypothetical protein
LDAAGVVFDAHLEHFDFQGRVASHDFSESQTSDGGLDDSIADGLPDLSSSIPEVQRSLERDEGPTILDLFRNQPIPSGESVFAGITASASDAVALRFSAAFAARKLDVGGSWEVGDLTSRAFLSEPAQVLIEFSDSYFASSVVLPGLFTSLVRDRFGANGIVYRDLQFPDESGAVLTENALVALESNTLRADAARDFAVKLREYKHANPILGVISSYLYSSIGDTNSIRRIASFYAEYGEAIPYDIALLGGLHGTFNGSAFEVQVPEVGERKPQTDAEAANPWTYCKREAYSGLVAGLWPWMRQGWDLLDDPSDQASPLILSGLVDLRSGLTRSRFATFTKDAGLRLAQLGNLNRVEPADRRRPAAQYPSYR